ncbi:glycosyltransferase [Candidatus Pelagibacter sp.]|nr:glycosyltransferase [Candidatus Pelagibacter sp.]
MNKTLIFTATYNESKNIAQLIDKILNLKLNIDILIVDDNSPDKTYEIIEKFKNKFDNIFLEKRSGKLGLNTAHIFGYEFALKHQYKNLITMDADLSHDPEEIPNIIKLLDNNAFVIGSRYIKGGKNDMKKLRLLLSIFGNKFIRIVLNSKGTEFTSSFRGFNLVRLKDFSFNQVKSEGYSFFMETVIRINRLGFKSFEFPIHFKNREHGVSKIPKIEIFRTLFNVLKLLIKKH